VTKKGQKFRKFTDEERAKIVGKYLKSNTYERIAKEYDISCKTDESMVRKYRKTGTTIIEKRDRPKGKDLTK
jgi:transposase-like protein